MFKNRDIIHRYIYIFALTVLGVMLPWSEFLMSAVQFLLLGNWILEGRFKNKLRILKKRKSILIFISIILVHFIWLFNTTDIKYALHDIQIKIPLLILPLIIGTSSLLSKKEFIVILKFFIASVFFASLFSIAIYLGFTKFEYTDYRELSVFISHIRFSLMIVMAIVIAFYLAKINNSFYKAIYIFAIIWFSVFIFFLQSYTGILIFIIITFIAIISIIYNLNKPILKYGIFAVFIIMLFMSFFWIKNSINKIQQTNNIDFTKLDKFTVNNNPYINDTTETMTENGTFVTIFINNYELEKEWNKQSKLPYNGLDNRNNLLKFTLQRYMASKGLRKDSVGFSKLTNNDIINIENGMPNYLFVNKFSLYVIMYKILWEYESTKHGQDINNKSILQRFEYLRIGKQIFTDNLFLGVGTGDIQQKFNEYYLISDSELTLKNRLRTHNQILTFLITFGIIGFGIIFFGSIYPIFFEQNKEKLLLNSFLIIAFLSFLDEDTLETQPGVTFIAYFYILFIFAYKKANFAD